MTAKDIVLTATSQLFGDKDPSAVDRWVAPGYIQHSTQASDGPEGLRALVSHLPEGFRYDLHRVIAEGDLVALHGTYHGFTPVPLVAFDIFRVQDGKLAEHWDALGAVVEQTVSGRSQTDGTTQITDREKTSANREVVLAFVEAVLKGGKAEMITDFISTTDYAQHNPAIGDGVEGLGIGFAALAQQNLTPVYDTVHHVVAEGDFVLTVSEGHLGVIPTAFYDLFRVAGAKIVEHWDITPEIPSDLPHTNGLF